MREATEEEKQSVKDYVDKISFNPLEIQKGDYERTISLLEKEIIESRKENEELKKEVKSF